MAGGVEAYKEFSTAFSFAGVGGAGPARVEAWRGDFLVEVEVFPFVTYRKAGGRSSSFGCGGGVFEVVNAGWVVDVGGGMYVCVAEGFVVSRGEIDGEGDTCGCIGVVVFIVTIITIVGIGGAWRVCSASILAP